MTTRQEYNRKWMKDWREKNKKLNAKKGRCPFCTMLLKPEYQVFHKGCRYFDTIHESI